MDLKKVKDKLAFVPDRITRFGKHFSETDFWNKIAKVATKAGHNLIYVLLSLFYGLEGAGTRDKLLILGALGYFILPVDMIPDLAPGGFTDDMAAAIAVYKIVKDSLKPEAFTKAKQRMAKWFPGFNPATTLDIEK